MVKDNIIQETGSCRVLPNYSSFMAESGALIQGLSCILQHQEILEESELGIFTDSRSVCSELQSVIDHYRAASDHTHQILDLLFNIATICRSVSIHWVPGHSQIGWNEFADRLAEEGHRSDTVLELATTRSSLHRYGKGKTQIKFQQYLDTTVGESQVNPRYPKRDIFKVPWERAPSGYSSAHRCVFKLLTGHTGTRAHKAALTALRNNDGEIKDPDEGLSTPERREKLCRFCFQHDETAEHVLLYCNKVEHIHYERSQLWLACGHYQLSKILASPLDVGRSVVTKMCYKLRRQGFWV